jgi:pilus assembly protein CpaF
VAALAAAATDVRLIVMHELDDVTPANEGVVRLSLPGDPEEAASLTRVASRIPAARMVVELVAPEVSAAVVDAIGEGSAGVVASLHGASLRRSLARLAVDVASARVGTPQAGGREAVAASFDVAVEVGRLRDTRLRVMRVAELAGTSADEIRTLDIFNFFVERTAAGGAIEGTFNASGHVPRCVEEITARGFALDSSLFTRPPSR